MAAELADAAALAGTRFERRWARRATPAAAGWALTLPSAALAALTFYAAGPFARADIEATVRAQTQATLAERGYGWVQVAVDGQNVVLRGTQPKPGDGDAALSIARDATCATWAGPLTCAVVVVGAFTDPPPPAPAAAPSTAPSTAATAAASCERSLSDIVARSGIEFAIASARIAPSSGPVLDALAAAARACDLPLRVEGHTDAIGAPAANLALSDARAAAVVAALVARGVPKARLRSQGFGAEQPIADNTTDAGRARNRRIALRVDTDTQKN